MADSQAADVAAQLREMVAKTAAALTLEVAANLREACPVDTGNARAHFVPHVGEADPGTFDAGVASVLAYKAGDGPLAVTNNVPYVPFLIGGSSSQAPAGWDVAAIDLAILTTQQQHDAVQIDVTSGAAGVVVSIKPREPGP